MNSIPKPLGCIPRKDWYRVYLWLHAYFRALLAAEPENLYDTIPEKQAE